MLLSLIPEETKMKVVLDTNVLVSALINANGIPAQILALVLNGRLKMLCDNRMIFEYIDVLSRKEFGFSSEIINDMIDCFRRDGDYINAVPSKVKFIDEADKKFYEVYKCGDAQYLITGNTKHFPREKSIITPKDFLLMYE